MGIAPYYLRPAHRSSRSFWARLRFCCKAMPPYPCRINSSCEIALSLAWHHHGAPCATLQQGMQPPHLHKGQLCLSALHQLNLKQQQLAGPCRGAIQVMLHTCMAVGATHASMRAWWGMGTGRMLAAACAHALCTCHTMLGAGWDHHAILWSMLPTTLTSQVAACVGDVENRWWVGSGVSRQYNGRRRSSAGSTASIKAHPVLAVGFMACARRCLQRKGYPPRTSL